MAPFSSVKRRNSRAGNFCCFKGEGLEEFVLNGFAVLPRSFMKLWWLYGYV